MVFTMQSHSALRRQADDQVSRCKVLQVRHRHSSRYVTEPKAYASYSKVDSLADIAQELGANSMPTFHIFKDGDVKDSVTGAKAQALEKAINSNYDGKVVDAPAE